MSVPPDLSERRDELLRLVTAPGRAGLFFDIDGTLAPIVPDPNDAAVPAAVRAALDALSRHAAVAVLTGRDVATARRMIGLDHITYSGNHGAEWWWDGQHSYVLSVELVIPQVQAAAAAAARELSAVQGIVIEDKGPTLSIHYRAADDPDSAADAIKRFIAAAGLDGPMAVRHGKKVVELRPPLHIGKGRALTSVVEERGLTHISMFGDDLTDVDAFTALRKLRDQRAVEGLAVAVLADETPRNLIDIADLSLTDTAAVEQTLVWLAAHLG